MQNIQILQQSGTQHDKKPEQGQQGRVVVINVSPFYVSGVITTELRFLKIIVLGKPGLLVTMAKYPIFYLASFFCYIPLQTII